MQALHVASHPEAAKPFLPESYETERSLVMVVEKSFQFLTEREFEEAFKVAPKQVPGLLLDSIRTETGQLQAGVLMTDPDSPYRKVRIQQMAGTVLSEKLLQPHAQLRVGQGQSMAAWYESDVVKNRPSAVRNVQSEADVKMLIQRHMETKQVEAEATAAAAASGTDAASGTAVAAAATEETVKAVEEVSSDDGDLAAGTVSLVKLPSAAAAKERHPSAEALQRHLLPGAKWRARGGAQLQGPL